jgi:lysozyme
MGEIAASGLLDTEPGSIVLVKDSRLAKPWGLSSQGMTFMAVWESGVLNGKFRGMPVQDGFILQVYDDHPENPKINRPTVGLGHVVQPNDKLKPGDKISLEKAKEFFKKNIEGVERQVNKKILVPLYQYEYDALASIAFNAGEYGGVNDLADFVNKGDYGKVPEFIERYRAKTDGKLKRRKSEANLFLNGNYDASH